MHRIDGVFHAQFDCSTRHARRDERIDMRQPGRARRAAACRRGATERTTLYKM
jgi:hypothetical protein